MRAPAVSLSETTMNSLDIGNALLQCDGETLTCGDASIPVASLAVEDGRVTIELAGLSICLLAEEWTALTGASAPALAEEAQEVAPKRRGRRA